VKGDTGTQGDTGVGVQGDTGTAGANGDTGTAGSQGDTGTAGSTGAGSNIRVYTWVIQNPAVGGVLGARLKEAHTATRIDSYVMAATSVTFNIEERSTIGTPGSDLLSADQVADVTGETTTVFADSALAADNWLYVDISAVSGTPGQVVIVLSCTVP
jgi:hypothetical protein